MPIDLERTIIVDEENKNLDVFLWFHIYGVNVGETAIFLYDLNSVNESGLRHTRISDHSLSGNVLTSDEIQRIKATLPQRNAST